MAPSTPPAAVAVSAPGKVLIAGGYLVLNPRHAGVVVATSARFYAVARPARTWRVHSPQFTDPPREYVANGDVLTPIEGLAPNKFVDGALNTALKHVCHALGHAPAGAVDLVVLADNDFYSQRAELERRGLPVTQASLRGLPAFVPTSAPLAQVKKTGLGSSAALVVALVGAVLRFYLGAPLDPHVVHNLAQFAHCWAQGKIGSGFDVASAVFGTHVYRRFPPAVLEPLLDRGPVGVPAAELVAALAPTTLGAEIRAFALPRGIHIMLADIAAGSNTPALVSRVLKWRAANPEDAQRQWGALDSHIAALVDAFAHLAAHDVPGTVEATYLSEAKAGAALDRIKSILANIRVGMRVMGHAAGVPIEPEAQTTLLDAVCAVPNVLGAGVPGAGGFDAIFVLYAAHNETEAAATRRQLEGVFAAQPLGTVTPLVCSASAAGLVDETPVAAAKLAPYIARQENAAGASISPTMDTGTTRGLY